jgi:hypothetical protein
MQMRCWLAFLTLRYFNGVLSQLTSAHYSNIEQAASSDNSYGRRDLGMVSRNPRGDNRNRRDDARGALSQKQANWGRSGEVRR